MRLWGNIAALLAGTTALLLPAASFAQEIFPRGELSAPTTHTGDIWLKELSAGDSSFDAATASAIYGPGAKLDWHVHPGGQVLLITQGDGYYQEKGKPPRLVHKGDVIKSAAGVEHWHGATPTSYFGYVAVTPTQKGKTIWRSRVTPAEYRAARR